MYTNCRTVELNFTGLEHGLSFCLSHSGVTKQTAIVVDALCPPGPAAAVRPDAGTSSVLDVPVCQSRRAVPHASARRVLFEAPSQHDAAR
jgi:hypothetical protein